MCRAISIRYTSIIMTYIYIIYNSKRNNNNNNNNNNDNNIHVEYIMYMQQNTYLAQLLGLFTDWQVLDNGKGVALKREVNSECEEVASFQNAHTRSV